MEDKQEARQRVITVRLNQREYDQLMEKLQLTRCDSMSEFIRKVSLDRKINSKDPVVNIDTYKTLRMLHGDVKRVVEKALNNVPYVDDEIHIFFDVLHALQDVSEELIEVMNNDCEAG